MLSIVVFYTFLDILNVSSEITNLKSNFAQIFAIVYFRFVFIYSYVSTIREEIRLTTLTLVNRKKFSVTFHKMGKLHLYTPYSK